MTTLAQNGRKDGQPAMHTPPVVSPQAWEAARKQPLVKEKAQTRAGRPWPLSAGGCRGSLAFNGRGPSFSWRYPIPSRLHLANFSHNVIKSFLARRYAAWSISRREPVGY